MKDLYHTLAEHCEYLALFKDGDIYTVEADLLLNGTRIGVNGDSAEEVLREAVEQLKIEAAKDAANREEADREELIREEEQGVLGEAVGQMNLELSLQKTRADTGGIGSWQDEKAELLWWEEKPQ
mgnify:CR=1 FL=1